MSQATPGDCTVSILMSAAALIDPSHLGGEGQKKVSLGYFAPFFLIFIAVVLIYVWGGQY